MPILNAFQWYGGKSTHLNWLLPLLPNTHTFVDVFGGSGAVLLNRYPAPVEVFNDINQDVVNFFWVLRNKYEELAEQLYYTPYARQELVNCLTPTTEPLERARRFFVRIYQGTVGKPANTQGDWGASIKINGRNRYASKYAPRGFYNKIEKLEAVADRLRNVQLENKSWEYILERYDTPNTFFYCDPPYLPDVRISNNDYEHELTEWEHMLLSNRLHNIKGIAAVSGYRSDLYDSLYRNWKRYEQKKKKLSGSIRGNAGYRQECLWVSYSGQYDDLPIFAR